MRHIRFAEKVPQLGDDLVDVVHDREEPVELEAFPDEFPPPHVLNVGNDMLEASERIQQHDRLLVIANLDTRELFTDLVARAGATAENSERISIAESALPLVHVFRDDELVAIGRYISC